MVCTDVDRPAIARVGSLACPTGRLSLVSALSWMGYRTGSPMFTTLTARSCRASGRQLLGKRPSPLRREEEQTWIARN